MPKYQLQVTIIAEDKFHAHIIAVDASSFEVLTPGAIPGVDSWNVIELEEE